MGCHSNAVSFYYLWYGAIYYKRQYTDKHDNACVANAMSMRASLENFGIFTFLNCYFFQYFVGTLKISPGANFIWGGGQAPPPPKPPISKPVSVGLCMTSRERINCTSVYLFRYGESSVKISTQTDSY